MSGSSPGSNQYPPLDDIDPQQTFQGGISNSIQRYVSHSTTNPHPSQSFLESPKGSRRYLSQRETDSASLGTTRLQYYDIFPRRGVVIGNTVLTPEPPIRRPTTGENHATGHQPPSIYPYSQLIQSVQHGTPLGTSTSMSSAAHLSARPDYTRQHQPLPHWVAIMPELSDATLTLENAFQLHSSSHTPSMPGSEPMSLHGGLVVDNALANLHHRSGTSDVTQSELASPPFPSPPQRRLQSPETGDDVFPPELAQHINGAKNKAIGAERSRRGPVNLLNQAGSPEVGLISSPTTSAASAAPDIHAKTGPSASKRNKGSRSYTPKLTVVKAAPEPIAYYPLPRDSWPAPTPICEACSKDENPVCLRDEFPLRICQACRERNRQCHTEFQAWEKYREISHMSTMPVRFRIKKSTALACIRCRDQEIDCAYYRIDKHPVCLSCEAIGKDCVFPVKEKQERAKRSKPTSAAGKGKEKGKRKAQA